MIGDSERIIEVLQRWGQQRAEVRFFLRHDRAPGHDTGEKERERKKVNRTMVKVFSKVTKIFQKVCLAPFTEVPLLFLVGICVKKLQVPYVSVYILAFAFRHEDAFFACPQPCISLLC